MPAVSAYRDAARPLPYSSFLPGSARPSGQTRPLDIYAMIVYYACSERWTLAGDQRRKAMTAILTKETSRGTVVVAVAARKYLDQHVCHVTLAGKVIGHHALVKKLNVPKGDITHYLSSDPPLGLTTDEAATIRTALAARDDADPEIILQRLRAERHGLVAAVSALVEEKAYQFDRAYSREDVNAWSIKASFVPRIAAAEQAVKDFDAAHPEVLAAIRAERAERVARAASL